MTTVSADGRRAINRQQGSALTAVERAIVEAMIAAVLRELRGGGATRSGGDAVEARGDHA